MLAKAGGMSVGLETAGDLAGVRLVVGVDMHVLLPIRGVGKLFLAVRTRERLLS